MMQYIGVICSFFSAFIITYFIMPKVIVFSKKFRLTDLSGDREKRERAIPIVGGIAIFPAIIISLLFWSNLQNIQFIIVSLFVVFSVGVLDDLLSLSARKKLLGQIIGILIIIYFQDLEIDNMHGVLGIFEIPSLAALLFTIFVVIVVTNGFNLIDGIDGLAGGIGIISSSFFGIIALMMEQMDIALLAFTLSGALIAFLKYNFYPARIYMGDAGSLVVGLILSILAINIVKHGVVTETIKLPNKGPLLAIAFLALPLFDSLRVFLNRVRTRKNPLSAGRDHVHHSLVDLGFGHKKTAVILYVSSLFIIGLSFLFLDRNLNSSITIIALICYIMILWPFYLLIKKRENEK